MRIRKVTVFPADARTAVGSFEDVEDMELEGNFGSLKIYARGDRLEIETTCGYGLIVRPVSGGVVWIEEGRPSYRRMSQC